jgi:DUF1365 family protein
MTDQQIVKVMLRYPLMTFGVVARIHLQALRLWLKRVPFFPNQLHHRKRLADEHFASYFVA